MTTLYTNLSLCIIFTMIYYILDKNNFVKVSHHYLTSGGYQVCLEPVPYGLIGMYRVNCKQTQELTTLYSHFLLS